MSQHKQSLSLKVQPDDVLVCRCQCVVVVKFVQIEEVPVVKLVFAKWHITHGQHNFSESTSTHWQLELPTKTDVARVLAALDLKLK